MRVAFLANGEQGSAMAMRASAFESRLAGDFQVVTRLRSARKTWQIVQWLWFLFRFRPDVCVVFDMAYSGVIAAGIFRFVCRRKVVIDTGDAIYELARSMGRSGIALWLTGLLERFSYAIADRIIVRSQYHREVLLKKGITAVTIPDGVDTEKFAPVVTSDEFISHDHVRQTTIGIIGSCVWSEKLGFCHGWELPEVMALLKEEPVNAVLIGSGSGVERLKAKCKQYGIADRVQFAGHVPYEKLQQYLSVIDICLSTQTNDIVGQVRTTGKLPLYLASGRFILATKVGEAARVLPPEMLVDYHGVYDATYPQRLASRLKLLLQQPANVRQGRENVALAQRMFDYSVLALRFKEVLEQCADPEFVSCRSSI